MKTSEEIRKEEYKVIQVSLRAHEVKSIVASLIFAYNTGKTSEEFGCFGALQLFKEVLKKIEEDENENK